ncbi:phosphopantetheine-binding protein [Nostoc sp. C110]|jgi:acyl carrier protein|uniref:phosphopantetheine-binding protein n=1 Tax=Nostoc sp. C110 TaxID=3349876 RepID=UPI00370D294D
MVQQTVEQQVLNVVTKHMRLNIEGLENANIDPTKSMRDLGATSLDAVEIASASMRELKVKVPRTKLGSVKNIQELVDLLAEVKIQQG